MFRKTTLISLVLASVLLAACRPAANPAPNSKLNVVATYSILGDIVQNVGGDQIELTILVGPNGDAHTFEPAPADSARIAEAALLFENGLGFETWLNDLYTASDSQAVRVMVTEGIEPRALEEDPDHAQGAEHPPGEMDPHVWHSVANAIQMTKNVRDALIRADAANTAVYEANAGQYLTQLQELDGWVFEQVKTLPANKRKLVTTHDTFGYFAVRYGFDIVGAALPATTESADPSAAEVAHLVEAIKAAGVPAIFAENVHNPKLMEQIASEADVTLAPTLYTDALGAPGSAGDTYLKLIRYNVTTIVAALNP